MVSPKTNCRMPQMRGSLSEVVCAASCPACRTRGVRPIRPWRSAFQILGPPRVQQVEAACPVIGTVYSDEASVFCYGVECRCLKQTSHSTDYPQLALLVRAIKYLGIYRQEALPKLPASCDSPRVRRTDGWSEYSIAVDYPLSSSFPQL